jgi:hypothetical protein
MSQPEAVSSAICCSVASTSAVTVVVMDCTEIGCSLPTPTLPTCSWRVGRRGASTGTGAVGIPRDTDIEYGSYGPKRIGLTMSAVSVSSMSPPPISTTT